MSDDRFSEEQARLIWRRAAQMQAEAAQRLEARSREVAARAEPMPEGFSQRDLEAAAVEAGIGREFVQLALAEGKRPQRRALSPAMDRLASRMLGTDRRSAEVSRVIAAPASDVFEAMQRIFPQYPYRLELRDSIGGDPLDGGVLVFATPSYFSGVAGDFALDMAYADMKELHVMMRPVEGPEGSSTEVVIATDLGYNRKLNFLVGGGVTGAGGVGGGAVAGAIAVAAGTAGAIVALPIVAGGLIGASLFTMGYRGMYRWGVGRGVRALERLLAALNVNVRTRGAFPQPSPEKPAES